MGWLFDPNPAGGWYLFPSGWGGIFLPPILNGLILGLLFAWHNQCHVTGCHWPTRRKTAAGERACWLHYAEATGRSVRRTVQDLCEEHHLYLGTRPGKG